jgi:thiol-disulfide isomerase/thioredoxin
MKALALAVLLVAPCAAQQDPETEAADPLQPVLERMFSERESPEQFEKAIRAARALGASDQAVLEARFLWHVDRREDAALAAMLPEFLERRNTFELGDSEIFAVREDWLAVVEYVQAIAALEKDDRAAFKRHITEAFWLSPRQGAAFAPHIERLRLDDAMRKVKVDFSLPLRTLEGAATTLGKLAGDDKAVVLHFFSPWSRECEASMPDLLATAEELAKHGIRVVNVIVEAEPEALEEARGLLRDQAAVARQAWVADNRERPLSRTLRVQNVPVMALVTPGGRVAFNGHPAEDALWQALERIAPEIRRPAIGEDH